MKLSRCLKQNRGKGVGLYGVERKILLEKSLSFMGMALNYRLRKWFHQTFRRSLHEDIGHKMLEGVVSPGFPSQPETRHLSQND